MFIHRRIVTETETDAETDVEADTETNADIDIDMMITVLDRGHCYSNGFNSAEFVLFTHSQRISVVTKD